MKYIYTLLITMLLLIGCAEKDSPTNPEPPVDETPTTVDSTKSDIFGKTIVGYQGWFSCAADNQPGGTNWWWHWSSDWNQPPSNDTKCLWAWPNVSEYDKTYKTSYANLNNGKPATLYSCIDYQTVDVQFKWMQENYIDGAALQRFNPYSAEGPMRDLVTEHVRKAAEAHDVKFYIMYDATHWQYMHSEMKADWLAKMSAYTSSPAYAHHYGKPVVAIWGFGFNDDGRPWPPAVCLEVVKWFKGQGCYVIGGVPREWRTGVGGSRPGFSEVYHEFDMISPWMVGALSDVNGADHIYREFMISDQADLNAHGMAYQPCILPGGLDFRYHGDLMWRMFYNAVRVGCQSIYISMYDEYNEGHQIAKTAPTQEWVPAGSGYLSLDYDGVECSSDYYLRLTGDGNRMLKGEIALTPVRPTQPMP